MELRIAFEWSSNGVDHKRDRTRLLYSLRIGMGTTSTVSLKVNDFAFFDVRLLTALGEPSPFRSVWSQLLRGSYFNCSCKTFTPRHRGLTMSFDATLSVDDAPSIPMVSKNFLLMSSGYIPFRFEIGPTATATVIFCCYSCFTPTQQFRSSSCDSIQF